MLFRSPDEFAKECKDVYTLFYPGISENVAIYIETVHRKFSQYSDRHRNKLVYLLLHS